MSYIINIYIVNINAMIHFILYYIYIYMLLMAMDMCCMEHDFRLPYRQISPIIDQFPTFYRLESVLYKEK